MPSILSSLALTQATGQNAILQFVPVIIIFAIFYFMLIAPMRKRQKALQALIDGLQKGDRVVTTGGLHGEVAAVKEGVVLLKVADNLRLKVSKSAITGMQGPDGEAVEK
jgi:preprotein translocase subunit YajC